MFVGQFKTRKLINVSVIVKEYERFVQLCSSVDQMNRARGVRDRLVQDRLQ